MNFYASAVTPELWGDFTRLFGERGACGGCWCMYWRQTAKAFNQLKGSRNRNLMKNLVFGGASPGLIGYLNGQPVGWIAVAPRTETPRLERSRIMAPVDDEPVWSITCLFVDKTFRKQGLSVKLIDAACDYAFTHGAEIVEAYPSDLPEGERQPDAFVYLGLAPAFRKNGFSEVARRSPKRPLMRKRS